MRRLLLLCLLALPALAQVIPATTGNDATGSGFFAPAATYPNAITAGDLLWLSYVANGSTTQIPTAFASVPGGSWTLACQRADGFNVEQIWYLANAAAQSSGVVVTGVAPFNVGGEVYIHEATHIAVSNVVDACTGNNGAGSTTYTSGTFTTTGANDWIVGATATANGSAITAGTGFAKYPASPNVGNVQYIDESGAFAAGTNAVTYTGPSTSYSTVAAAFKPLVAYDFTIGGATSGYAKAASGNITVTKSTGNWTACTITVSDGLAGASRGVWGGSMSGTGTGTFVANAINTFNATYTPAIAAAVTLTWSSSCGSNPPLNTTYTSNPWTAAITGCTSGNLNVTSGTCTITLTGGTFGGIAVQIADFSSNVLPLGNGSTIIANASTGTGSLVITPSSGTTQTFTFTPIVVGKINLTVTFGVAYITAPTPVAYTVTSTDVCHFAAKASGAWASAGTWTASSCTGAGHAFPISGDGPVTITGFHVTCATGTCYAGTNPGNNTTYDLVLANNGSTASGQLEVANGANFWLTGNYQLASSAGASPTTFAILTVDSGGKFIHDVSNGSTAYRGTAATTSNWNKIQMGDLTGNTPCNFSTQTCPTGYVGVNNGTVNPVLMDQAATSDNVTYEIYGTLLENLGSATKGALEIANANANNGYANGGLADIEGNLWVNTGTVQANATSGIFTNTKLTIANNHSPVGSDLVGWFSTNGASNASTPLASCSIHDNFFDGVFAYRAGNQQQLTGCALWGNIYSNGDSSYASLANPYARYDTFIRMIVNANNYGEAVTDTPLWGPVSNGMTYYDTTGCTGVCIASNHMGWQPINQNASLVNVIGDSNEATVLEAHCGGGVTSVLFTSTYSTKAIGNLSTIAPSGAPACSWGGYAQGQTNYVSSGLTYLDHNTVAGLAIQGWIGFIGHPTSVYPTNSGALKTIRSNIGYSPTAGTVGNCANTGAGCNVLLIDLLAGTNTGGTIITQPNTILSAAANVASNYTWNAVSPTVAGYSGSVFAATPYMLNVASGTPGTTTNANPNFIDSTRNLAKWASTQGQANSIQGARAALTACQVESYCIQAALTYIRTGFQPVTLAMKGKALDGYVVGVTGTAGTGWTGTCSVAFTPQDALDLGTGATGTCSFVGGSPAIAVINRGQYYRIATPAQIVISQTGGSNGTAGSQTVVVQPQDPGAVSMNYLASVAP